jgi:hypothetical protein
LVVLILGTGRVSERLRVREIDDDEGRRLVRIIRRGSGSVVTWLLGILKCCRGYWLKSASSTAQAGMASIDSQPGVPGAGRSTEPRISAQPSLKFRH